MLCWEKSSTFCAQSIDIDPECMPYVIVGIVMFCVVKVVSSITGNGWLSLGVQVLIGGIVYCIGVLLYMYSFKREFLDRGFRSILRKLKL